MDNCRFIGNVANYYGAVYADDLNAINCDFINNSAADSAGALHAYNINLDCCNFENNQAEYAGAIDARHGVLNHCKFDGNCAQKLGSVIVIRGNLKILNSNFTNNVAGGGKLTTFGYSIDIYGNGAIVLVKNGNSGIKTVNCSGIVKNTDKFKHVTKLSASDISMAYGNEKSLTVVLTGDFNDNAISGAEVSININGKVFKETTNKNGKAVVSIPKLAPGKYVVKITYAGDNFNKKASKNVNLVVSKATPKLTASKKSFKASVKTKKYSVTLKDNKNKVMKKAKLTLTVNGKTFKATTNSKGTATFKITNLNKKQGFKAVVKYAGNKYYNKITKSVKLTVK